MTHLEDFLKPTQNRMFQSLCKMYRNHAVCAKGKFLLVHGEAPVLLVAHLDTVHESPVRTICTSQQGNILMSPQGIGGDDRCGVYALVNAYGMAEKKPWLLFTCDEEIGGVGARFFAAEHEKGTLPEGLSSLKLILELDRKGSHDAVYYDCANKEFEAYITGKGFQTAFGSFSDISIIAPALDVAAVNLSSGYYNAHTLHEYIHRRHLDATIRKVVEIIGDAAGDDFPRYDYIEKVWEDSGSYDHFGFPKNLPEKYMDAYDALLDYFSFGELESYRKTYGNAILNELYGAY